MVETLYNIFTFLGAVNRCLRYLAHQGWQGSAMVIFVVVHDNVVNIVEVNNLFQPTDELLIIRSPHGINKGSLLVPYQV